MGFFVRRSIRLREIWPMRMFPDIIQIILSYRNQYYLSCYYPKLFPPVI